MKENKITIIIHKPISEVFIFTTTPPNSTLWIPGIISEVTNELPIKKGTMYTLGTKGSTFSVWVNEIKSNELIEWKTVDGNYHCRYTYKEVEENSTELIYREWAEKGNLNDPFSKKILYKLKKVLEEQ